MLKVRGVRTITRRAGVKQKIRGCDWFLCARKQLAAWKVGGAISAIADLVQQQRSRPARQSLQQSAGFIAIIFSNAGYLSVKQSGGRS